MATTETTCIPQLLTVAEVLAVLRVSRATLWRLTSRGDLPVVRIGDRTLFRPRDVARFVERSSSPHYARGGKPDDGRPAVLPGIKDEADLEQDPAEKKGSD